MPRYDRHDLYELCVQSPRDLVPLLRALHGGDPVVLGEDFCGTGALARAWVGMVDGGRVIAVDHDPEPLARLAGVAGIEVITGDVVRDTTAERHAAEVVYAGNFSIGEWHTRDALLAYLRHARSRLRPGGVFVCDTYGGESAWLLGSMDRDLPLPGEDDGRVVRYTWEQRRANPLTGLVENALHFRIREDDETVAEQWDAFVYRWRLWGVAELRDAMAEAGFRATTVHARVPDAIDDAGRAFATALDGDGDVEDTFDVLVAARRETTRQLPR